MKNLYDTDSAIKIVPTISVWMVMKVLLVTLLGTAATLFYLSKTPRKYESESKLLVRLGRESITLDPTVTNGQVVSVSDSRESEVNAFSDLLTSRVILEKVVDKLGPGFVMGETDETKDKKSFKDNLTWLNQYNLNPFQVFSERDDAIEHLSKHLEIRTGKRSALITATIEAEDPHVAREVLNEVVTQARNEHVKANHTLGSEEFFEKQVALFKSEVSKHEDALRDLKDASGISAFDQQQQLLLERIGELETDLASVTAERDAVEK
ncbi:MAG: Wzz/FepE/Etk N-terminal domain-containing protein [Pirellulales bacterium]